MKRVGFQIGERRRLYWFKEVGNNVKEWGSEALDYVREPLKKNDYVGATIGSFKAMIAAVVTLPDAVYAGIADQKLERPAGSRFGRDLSSFGSNVVGLHPIRAALDVLRAPGSLVMDIIGGTRKGLKSVLNNRL